MRETRVRSLGREDPLEREMAIHSSTLAWKIPWMEEPDRLQSMGSQRVGYDWATSLHFHWLTDHYILWCIWWYMVYFWHPCGAVVENPFASAKDVRDVGSVPGLGRSPGAGNGNPLQYSCLDNFMDRGAWQAVVHGITKSQTWLSDEHYTFTLNKTSI